MRTIVCVVAVLAFASAVMAELPHPGTAPRRIAVNTKVPAVAPLGGHCDVGGNQKGVCLDTRHCGIGSVGHHTHTTTRHLVCAGHAVCCVDIPASSPFAPKCPKAKVAMTHAASVEEALMHQCKIVQKQREDVCAKRVVPKLNGLRIAINNQACAPAGHTAAPAKPTTANVVAQRKALLEVAAAHANAGTPPPTAPTNFIGKLANYFVQKAAGITPQEAADGCLFQIEQSCVAFATDCADTCIGEAMAGCQTCFNNVNDYPQHWPDSFEKCCKCPTVRQYGISSCSY